VKSIITYTRDLKAQNLYPKRIISPPAPNKCCRTRMEVLGRPRVDEHGRRFCYKRCQVCGFALRYFLEPVPSILIPATPDAKPGSAPAVNKARVPPTPPAIHPAARRPPPMLRPPTVRPSAVRPPSPGRRDDRHGRVKPAPRRPHAVQRASRKSSARRRR
jgi:hypothetical protein